MVGALALLAPAIYRRRPGNPIGAMFARLVLNAGVIVLTDSYSALVPHPDVGSRPHDDLAAWIANFAWVPFTTVLLCELPLRFPDGVLLSPRWRWAERARGCCRSSCSRSGSRFAPGRMNSYPIDNPYPGGDLFTVLRGIGFALLIACVGLRRRRDRRCASAARPAASASSSSG